MLYVRIQRNLREAVASVTRVQIPFHLTGTAIRQFYNKKMVHPTSIRYNIQAMIFMMYVLRKTQTKICNMFSNNSRMRFAA